ncbi:hypothetical protein HZC30_07785 [Candidatus Woesearchaeota archaeon]|nr:hypothetical protein [Candidatus Woesearchaeota archaeon]
MEDYEQLLHKAEQELPEKSASSERFVIDKVIVEILITRISYSGKVCGGEDYFWD